MPPKRVVVSPRKNAHYADEERGRKSGQSKAKRNILITILVLVIILSILLPVLFLVVLKDNKKGAQTKGKKKGKKVVEDDPDSPKEMLYKAILGGKASEVETLLTEAPEMLNEKDGSGKTALMLAAEYKNEKVFEVIMNFEPDIKAVDKKGNTALHYGAQVGSVKICDMLLSKNADPAIKNKDDEVPLTLALKGKHELTSALLVKASPSGIIDAGAKAALGLLESELGVDVKGTYKAFTK